jgi:hypothetical protein
MTLQNIKIAMDRGYWVAKLLFKLLNLGTHVYGTIKRINWLPMMYNSSKKINDSKQPPFPEASKKISLSGYKDSYYMELVWKGNISGATKLCLIVNYAQKRSRF